MNFEVFPAESWLFPDSTCGKKYIQIHSARNSYACCQILLDTAPEATVTLSIEKENALSTPECFEILPVSVNENSKFIEQLDTEHTPLEEMPMYYTKTAPFDVYDALKPVGSTFSCQSCKTAIYLKWHISKDIKPGEYKGLVCFECGSDKASVPYTIRVAKATVPENKKFRMVNWISPNSKYYDFEPFSEEHWTVLEKINRLGCEAHQTHVNLGAGFFVYEGDVSNPHFNFDRAERYIKMCFGLGCKYIEGPSLLDMHKAKIPGATEKTLGNDESIKFLKAFLTQWYDFLVSHDYVDITVQHIFDEPSDKKLEIYNRLGKLIRETMPGIKTLDAVLSAKVCEFPDIVIPTTRFYQLHKAVFDALKQNGHELWLYTCCWPSAPYLNRFLDMPLLSVRYIHWLCYLQDVSAYLHWGFCFQANCQDVFVEPSIPFKIFDDSLEQFLPPGDTNIVYPYMGAPLGSVRLEMQRAGIEDFELLSMLDDDTAQGIAKRSVHSDFTADLTQENFDAVHSCLLDAFE